MSCVQTISGILRDCAPSMGGIKRAWVANYDDVAAVTETTGKVSGLTMESGKTFKEFAFRKGSSSFTSTLNVDAANGVSYVTQLALQRRLSFVNTGEWNIPMGFDGVHFSEEGHRIFADRMLEVLSSVKDQ